MSQQRLGSYGADPTPDPPQMYKRRRVRAYTPSGEKHTGWYGPCPTRDCYAYVAIREETAHRLHELMAWAVSESALARLREWGVGVIFVHDVEHDDVYEYTDASDLLRGPFVHPQWLEDIDDDQRFVHVNDSENHPDTDAVGPDYIWEGHGTCGSDAFYVKATDPRVKAMTANQEEYK